MKFAKRYSIINFYVNGSSQIPQYGHGLNNLWKNFHLDLFSKEAKELFFDWAFNAETEVVLKGGDHESMEKLFEEISEIKSLPVAKFNEIGMRDTCSVVTFVADERIVSGVNFARNNRMTPYNVANELKDKLVDHINSEEENFILTETEISVISRIAFLSLAN